MSTITPLTAFATDDSQSSGSSSSGSGQPVPAPAPALLYRVRYGALWRGEIADRFYIERNIVEAEKAGIIGDDDPDGDGWAIVGHTSTDYDGRKIGGFTIAKIAGQKVPSIMLYWDNDTRCASLAPISLLTVLPNEDRLLKATAQRMCFAPVTNIGVTILTPPLEQVTQAVTEPLQPQPYVVPQQQTEAQPTVIQPIEPETETVVLDSAIVGSAEGHVEAASTNQVPNYFDGPGKNSAEVAHSVGDSFLIGVSVIVAVLLAVVLFIKSLALFSRS